MSSPFLSALRNGLARGLSAGRENFLPALFIQLLMAALVAGYYLDWPTTRVLGLLAAGREQGGQLFIFLASGLSGGLLSELCVVYFLQSGRWRRHNAQNALFKFVLFGVLGITGAALYAGLARWLGDAAGWRTVGAKTLLDQFGYTAFFSCPLSVLSAHWKNSGWRPAAWRDAADLDFLGGQYVPLLVTNWCFWFPVLVFLYALPLPLQYPLALLATAIWALLVVSVTARKHPELESIQG